MKKVFITTPIYYPNADLHIGHAYTTVIADALSRFHKSIGNKVYFTTGADEHGKKIEEAAKRNNKNPKDYVSEIVINFKKLWKNLEIDYDLFIRTSDEIHEKNVQDIFLKLQELDLIYKGNYTGKYCVNDEAFVLEKDIISGKCPTCNGELIDISEESYFLKVSVFTKWIKEVLLEGNLLFPTEKVKELTNNFLSSDLRDLSISRSTFNWGIKVPGDNQHVIYVWFDALLNYISSLKYTESPFTVDEIWKEDSIVIHLVGKEITRFHAIYWPIILNALNYKVPKVYAHGWLLMDGEKMSKSKGNIINPNKLIEEYSSDAIRFFLLYSTPFGNDGSIFEKDIKLVYNGILVNKFSNLISRTYKMLSNSFEMKIPNGKLDSSLKIDVLDKVKSYNINFEDINIRSSILDVIDILDIANKFIDDNEVWKQTGVDLENSIFTLVWFIYVACYLLNPIIPNSTNKVITSIFSERASIEEALSLLGGKVIKELGHLFNRK